MVWDEIGARYIAFERDCEGLGRNWKYVLVIRWACYSCLSGVIGLKIFLLSSVPENLTIAILTRGPCCEIEISKVENGGKRYEMGAIKIFPMLLFKIRGSVQHNHDPQPRV